MTPSTLLPALLAWADGSQKVDMKPQDVDIILHLSSKATAKATEELAKKIDALCLSSSDARDLMGSVVHADHAVLVCLLLQASCRYGGEENEYMRFREAVLSLSADQVSRLGQKCTCSYCVKAHLCSLCHGACCCETHASTVRGGSLLLNQVYLKATA